MNSQLHGIEVVDVHCIGLLRAWNGSWDRIAHDFFSSHDDDCRASKKCSGSGELGLHGLLELTVMLFLECGSWLDCTLHSSGMSPGKPAAGLVGTASC